MEVPDDEVHKTIKDFRDVNPIAVGLEANGGEMKVFIARNAAVPSETTKVFTNSDDYCELISFKIFQGERALVRDCEMIGEFDVSGFG